jgi:hypothetical protein
MCDWLNDSSPGVVGFEIGVISQGSNGYPLSPVSLNIIKRAYMFNISVSHYLNLKKIKIKATSITL